MKGITLVSFILLLPTFILQAQHENKVFEKVELNAGTDQKAWTDHIAKNTRLPDSVVKVIPAGTYKVNIQFVVDVHGSVGQVKAKNDPGYGLAKKAVDIISSYKGKWRPAIQCGRYVKSYEEQAISFVITSQ